MWLNTEIAQKQKPLSGVGIGFHDFYRYVDKPKSVRCNLSVSRPIGFCPEVREGMKKRIGKNTYPRPECYQRVKRFLFYKSSATLFKTFQVTDPIVFSVSGLNVLPSHTEAVSTGRNAYLLKVFGAVPTVRYSLTPRGRKPNSRLVLVTLT